MIGSSCRYRAASLSWFLYGIRTISRVKIKQDLSDKNLLLDIRTPPSRLVSIAITNSTHHLTYGTYVGEHGGGCVVVCRNAPLNYL